MTTSILVLSVLVTFKIAYDDLRIRTVRHRYLLCLAVLFLSLWTVQPNYEAITYSLIVIIAGFFLDMFRLLGAGDSKLLAIILLGVDPKFFSLVLYGAIFLGGIIAVAYYIYGVFTDLSEVRKKGIPFAVPIAISGAVGLFLSHISWFGLNL